MSRCKLNRRLVMHRARNGVGPFYQNAGGVCVHPANNVRAETIPDQDLISWFSAADIPGDYGDKVGLWDPRRPGMSILTQSDPLLQPIKGPYGGLLPEAPDSGQHLQGGDWCDPLAANAMTVLVCFILHELTNGALLGSNPSTPDNRASMSHWGDGDTYLDWGDIVSGGPGRLSFTYQPALLELTTTGMRKDGPQFDAFIDGVYRTGRTNTTNYTGDGTSGGMLMTHVVAPGQTDSAMAEILEIAVWDRPLTDLEVKAVHDTWMQKYAVVNRALADSGEFVTYNSEGVIDG